LDANNLLRSKIMNARSNNSPDSSVKQLIVNYDITIVEALTKIISPTLYDYINQPLEYEELSK